MGRSPVEIIIINSKKHKKCSKCKILKPFDDFNNCKKNTTGTQSFCMNCNKEYLLKYNIEKKEERSLKSKTYRKNNKEKEKRRHKTYYEKNKNTVIKEYRKKNADRIAKKDREYREANREKINKQKGIYKKNKKRTNFDYKMKENIRSLFYNSFLKNDKIKDDSIFIYTGCDYLSYIEHFKKSKYWNDYCKNNQIHIDHIIPISAYDFKDENEIRKCWHPKNLRLIPFYKNIAKSDSIDYELIYKHKIEHLLPERIQNAL